MASDHSLVVAKMRVKLRKYNTNNPKAIPRYNIKLLQDPQTLRTFQIVLSNRYQALADLHDEDQQLNTEDTWKDRKQGWTQTSNEVLGPRQKQHK